MGAWEEIVDYVVPSNTTSVTLNNFGTITKDDFIKIVFTLSNTNSQANFIRAIPTGATVSNFHNQVLIGRNTSLIAGRENAPATFNSTGNSFSTSIAYLKLSENDRFNIFINGNNDNGSSVETTFAYGTSTSTFTSGITSLNFEEVVSGRPIAANSRIQVYKLTAEKVADITVNSNTTQVDITGLDIKKGDEYLLVSDGLNPQVNTGNLFLFVNDNTTTTNYYMQQIFGNNTSASASRQNNPTYFLLPRVNLSPTPTHNIAYTHIKLSNVGAFTYQSYNLARGTSALELYNWFGSSTAENITSITKLNLVSNVSNSIGTNSRFQLYKLYEGGN